MKTREFEVPTGIITAFADLLIDHNLTNEIIGLTEESELIIAVRYEDKDKSRLFALIELMDDYQNNREEE